MKLFVPSIIMLFKQIPLLQFWEKYQHRVYPDVKEGSNPTIILATYYTARTGELTATHLIF